jgi:hypothetical protein
MILNIKTKKQYVIGGAMKKILLLILFIIISAVFVSSPTLAQERIRESVEVKWWVIPLFVVDSSGNSVMDLQEGDIKLLLDDKVVSEFVLFRKTFSVTGDKDQAKAERKDPLKDKEKMIFFLFDTALTSKDSIARSRKIAMNIVENSDKNNRFVIMSITPNSGLVYSGGPTNDKGNIDKLIEKRVLARSNIKISIAGDVLRESSAGNKAKYEGHIMPNLNEITSFLVPHHNRTLKQKNVNFFKSFETLFYAVNTIKSNKFIYLFTEGIPKNSQAGDKRSLYQLYLKKVADHLSQSGAVLFIVNPSGTEMSNFSTASGEDSLRFLAKESGGKYFEGAEEQIASSMENIHRAYYEIGFSDLPDAKVNTRRVTIKSKRKGIKIHTLRSLKESNNYAQMKKIGKEMLALNLISKNPLFHISFPFKDITIDKIERSAEETVFFVTLPEDFLEHKIDLFQIWVDSKSREPKIKRRELVSMRKKMAVRIANIKRKENHFVIIDGETNSALVGRFDYLEDGKIAGFKTAADGSLVLSKINLKEVEFKEKTLTLLIEDFLLKRTANGAAGKVDIRVSIQNMQGLELFNKEKGLIPEKETIVIAIPFNWLKRGRYKIVVEVKDQLTGKSDRKSIRPQPESM